jgi:hypothetical protein
MARMERATELLITFKEETQKERDVIQKSLQCKEDVLQKMGNH